MPARKTTNKTRAAKSKTTAKTKTVKTTKAKKTTKTAKTKLARASSKSSKSTATARRQTSGKSVAELSFPSKAIAAKQTKSEIFNEIAELTGTDRKNVKAVFAALRNIIERHVKPKGSGEFTIPELGIKVRRIVKKATKARMGRNPFTGEEIKIPAKPSRKSVKVTALKTLKSILEQA